MEKINKLYQILKKYHEPIIYHDHITVYGYQFNYDYDIRGSISKFYFPELVITDYLIDQNNANRPNQLIENLQYIVFHDTASTAETADTLAHKNYVTSPNCPVSWHYSVGDLAIFRHLPDNEVAYHAGDGVTTPFSLINTNVKATELSPKITVKDGYLYLNEQSTSYQIEGINDEKTVTINDLGIRIETIDGFYYVGPLYYNKTYRLVANRGGNLHSIGMETMINVGNNVYQTWLNAAKLTATLLLKYQLPLNRVKSHHFFSGKNCPMTMRESNNWERFTKMVEAHYEILPLLTDCQIKFKSLSPYLNESGMLVEEPPTNTKIEYQVTITDKNESHDFIFESLYK